MTVPPRSRSRRASTVDLALRCGVDLVSVNRLRESLARHGERFVARLFTAAERHDVDTRSGTELLRAQRLAARFAAKEACIKALGLSTSGWTGATSRCSTTPTAAASWRCTASRPPGRWRWA